MNKSKKQPDTAAVSPAAGGDGKDTAESPRRPSFMGSLTPEKSRNILLGISAVQLVLAVLMYMLPSVNNGLLLAEAAVAVALALFVRFGPQESRAFRVIMRTVFLLLILVPLIFTVVTMIWTNSLRSLDSSETTQAFLTLSNWFLFADVALPPLLFLQPVLALNTRGSHAFDRVLLRILAALTLIGSVLLCFFALEYTTPDGGEILTEITYYPVLFGHTFTIPIAFENILTRILLCGLSAAALVFSFLPAARRRDGGRPAPASGGEKAGRSPQKAG
ncbi:MAG TPA: hypothetical protein H9684_11300 [Firmicutes bacterium]|nr:hypothetical protein [Bacillota bacterium]